MPRDRDERRDKERPRDRDLDREKDRQSTREKRRREEEKESDERIEKKQKEEIAPKPAEEPVPQPRPLEPMDVESLVKQREEQEKALKPVFLSKAEREKLALERRAKEVEEKQKKIEEARKKREEFEREAEKQRIEEERKRRDKDREERERSREEERRRREKDRDDKSKAKTEPKDKTKSENSEDKEKELIKKAYLGGKKEKKKIIKPSEKFKFVFDWDVNENTEKELDPLHSSKYEIKPMFGRGSIAGIDKSEQKKDKKAEAEVIPKHWSEKTLEEMTERDWRIFKEDFNISTRGGSIPNPIRNWKETTIRSRILKAIEQAGYKEPTPIQRQAIPLAMQGRDLMGIAETGSGKTAAFVIPMLEYILKLPKMTPENETDGPYALILAPTRELAVQTEQEVKKLAAFCDIRVMALVGGVNIDEQGFSLRRGCEVIVATPGRLNDLITSRYLALHQCNYVVLDEADRMIDMGFEPQVNSILDAMPASSLKSEVDAEARKQEEMRGQYRTTIMYSATMPTGVERLSRKYLRRPAYVIIGEVGKAVDKIQQRVEMVSQEGKLKKLAQILNDSPPPPIMIFVNQRKHCDPIAKQVEKFGWSVTTLHSGRSQQARESAMEGFKAGRYDVLVATDVAGRGIDVTGVTHVINFDFPKTIEDYTHRIGRTGRAGREGLATSFLTPEDTDVMFDLKNMLQASNSYIPPDLANHPAAQHKPGSVAAEKASRKETIIYAK